MFYEGLHMQCNKGADVLSQSVGPGFDPQKKTQLFLQTWLMCDVLLSAQLFLHNSKFM